MKLFIKDKSELIELRFCYLILIFILTLFGDDFYLISNPIGQKDFYQRELNYIKDNASKYGYDFIDGLNTGKLQKKGGVK